MEHINHRATWSAARISATLAVAVAVGLGLVGCGYGSERLDPASATGSPAATAGPDATGSPDGDGAGPEPGGGSQSGGADTGPGGAGDADGTRGDDTGSGAGDDDGGAGGPDNEPPYIRDLYLEAYVYGEEGERVIAADLTGHAYDPDSQHDQGNVARLSVDWGDGTSSDGSLEGHGAVRAYHDYDLSGAGETMTARIVAHGYDGQTASETVQLALPEE